MSPRPLPRPIAELALHCENGREPIAELALHCENGRKPIAELAVHCENGRGANRSALREWTRANRIARSPSLRANRVAEREWMPPLTVLSFILRQIKKSYQRGNGKLYKMSTKPKSHKAMGDGEWMARLRAFASSGAWPSGAGNRPAPRQRKWYDLYQKIEKCPLQAHGQTTLFGGSTVCSCGFHTTKPATATSIQAAAAPPQSEASDTTPAPRSFLRPPPSLSMFTKSRFGGSQLASLKPNLVERRTPSPSPSSVRTPSPSPPSPSPSPSSVRTVSPSSSSVRTPSPSPSSMSTKPKGPVRTPSPSPSSVRTPSPSPSSVRTPSPSPSSMSTKPKGPVRTPSPSPSSLQTHIPAPFSEECGRVQPAPAEASASFWLPGELGKTIPVQDQRWIANTLFHSGKLRPDLKLWYEPPVPALIYHQTPTPDRFFTHRLMVWMPYHLWKVRVSCPACGKNLTGYGVHKRARKVLDIDRYYLMVTETLRCTVCSLNYLSTSQTVRDQLDLPHQKMFRLILTRKYACDIRVIRLLRDRTLGNSPTRLVRQLKENHGEEWLNRLAHYLGECADFVDRPSLFPVVCQEPPEPIDVPSSRWLLSVYGRDILSRILHIKASITSIFGKILKMDSTKKITKKLAGHGRGTALWVTSIGNEVGQILNSVLSVQEGPGLDRMVAGVMERYRQAAVPPPVLLYVDCGCCVNEGATSKLQTRFGEWPDLHIHLDIWHFMRRLAVGCTTDAHPLYPTFMGSLSVCIFEWDAGDLSLLRQAKRKQLMQEGVPAITDILVDRSISKKELGLYCRRRTRGEEATIRLIERLLQELRGANGRDLMGVPVLDEVRMEHIWRVQKRHVRCIQDMPGVQLYTEVGTTTKAGVTLTRYRCARGSTSLESFHCHLNRFIPGTSANALNFQLYLLEGLNRWNQDRAAASVTSKPASLLTYSGDMAHCVNTSSLKVFGRPFVPTFRPPARYTGELLGVDYLLSQTGQPLVVDPDSEVTENMLEHVDEGEDEENEGFGEDQTHDITVSSLTDDPSFSVSSHFLPFSESLSSTQSAAPSSQPASSSTVAAASSTQCAASSTQLGTPFAQPADSCTQPAALSTQPAASSTSTAPSSTLAAASSTPGVSASPDESVVSNIVALWQNLLDYDKQRVVFAARHQSRLDTERFRSPKKRQEFTPGVESVKRHALTTTAPLAQWPDCCRLIETIFVKLCAIHKSPKKKGIDTFFRWDLILEDYRKIRQCILTNAAVMQQTTLQLVDVSHTTLVQWHNRRVKKQDSAVVMQGLQLPSRLSVAADPLLPANVRPPTAPPQPGPAHQYHLPSSTVGQAQTKRKRNIPSAPVVSPPAEKPPAQRQLFPAPPPGAQLVMLTPMASQGPTGPVLFAAPQALRLSLSSAPPAPSASPAPAAAPVRKLTRKVQHNTCKKCGQFRTAETGHSQYKGTIYCPSVETVSKEQWLEDIKKTK
ncbi:hypothetical protein ROHU_036759 [Labeo rohita]|uniref:DUF6729 domain-containing protein n=1 Tax=Labeo rohita TaxID=84645 RepID=A0A498MP17_LABRO|nr:hypothetical protein ROHU_036759 [Labeo rohita]